MSHFTTIQTQIRDLEALNDACVEMELKLTPNTLCRGYAGVTRQAPHVIQLKGPYDIAVDPSPENDGSYGLTTDWWNGHAAREVGIGYGSSISAPTMRMRRSASFPTWARTTHRRDYLGS